MPAQLWGTVATEGGRVQGPEGLEGVSWLGWVPGQGRVEMSAQGSWEHGALGGRVGLWAGTGVPVLHVHLSLLP